MKKKIMIIAAILILIALAYGGNYFNNLKKYDEIMANVTINPIDLNTVKEQSLEVDTVSGATNSSLVILKSIENALSQ